MKKCKLIIIILIIILILNAGCGLRVDIFEIATSMPDIHVSSGSLPLPSNNGRYNFGEVDPYSYGYGTFTIQNRGDAKLRITGISFLNEDLLWFNIDTTSLISVLKPGESSSFTVSFKPNTSGLFSAQLLIVSNDPENGRYLFTVEGYGTASGSGTPAISACIGDHILPAPYDFGAVSVGMEKTVQVKVENRGTATLDLADLYITPGVYTRSDDFRSVAPEIPSAVETGESVEFDLMFYPTMPGPKSAVVTILSDDPLSGQFHFTMSGEGYEYPIPDIVLRQDQKVIENTVGSYDFGSVWIGDLDPPSADFTIMNAGSAPLLVTGISIPYPNTDGFIVHSSLPMYIDPADSGLFTVRFDPDGSGLHEEIVEIRSTDPDANPFTFSISGTGATEPVPDINIIEVAKDDSFDMGPVPLGSVEVQPFTVENTGVANLMLHSIISKDDVFFAVDDSQISYSSPIHGGGRSSFFVLFTPQDTKMRKTTIEVKSNDLDEDSYRFSLYAYGSSGSQPDINVSESGRSYPDGSKYFFPDMYVGEKTTVLFDITNQGSGDLVISSIILKGKLDDFTLEVPSFSAALPPGHRISVRVTFNPVKSGKRSARLVIGSEDPDEGEYKVSLEGRGETN